MHRVIDGLRYAAPCVQPQVYATSRPRGNRAKGLRFERKLAKSFPQAIHGQWFTFIDSNGRGFCQPDFLLPYGDHVVILECKLTDCTEGRDQIRDLYGPVVSMATRLPTLGILVVKHLTPESKNIVTSLENALNLMSPRRIPTLHWLGFGRFV